MGKGGSPTYTITTPSNPPPTLSGLSPAYVSAGSQAFTLIVKGSGFTAGSTVYWGASALATQFASENQLSVQVPRSGVEAWPGTAGWEARRLHSGVIGRSEYDSAARWGSGGQKVC